MAGGAPSTLRKLPAQRGGVGQHVTSVGDKGKRLRSTNPYGLNACERDGYRGCHAQGVRMAPEWEWLCW
jgi:hypothetical protein